MRGQGTLHHLPDTGDQGLDQLAAASDLEAAALSRIGASGGLRLACQIRPTADLSIMPLLAADANAADGTVRGGLEGSERPITVVFVDLRGSTTLGEARLPYDVLFILNQFFHEMTQALVATNGHYSQFTGDGLMALYGLYAVDPATGPADAMRGAREMLQRLDQLNYQMRGDLREPLRSASALLQRRHCRRDGAAALPDHYRDRRYGEYLRAARKPHQGLQLRRHYLAASCRGGRLAAQRAQIASGAGQRAERTGRILRLGDAGGFAGVNLIVPAPASRSSEWRR